MQKKFLSAHWEKLLIANYTCDPELLQPLIPAGTEIDFFNNQCLISVVAFQFLHTKVLNISFPWHSDFVEINLRFYVKRKSGDGYNRGVVFIKEIVPRFMISFIANTVFNENYETMKTGFSSAEKNSFIDLNYFWGKNNFFSCRAKNNATPFNSGSLEEFITEHYWGFAHVDAISSMEYQVEHPKWNIFPIKDFSIQCHFKQLYGESFSFLDEAKPHSVLLAQGSKIIVRRGIKFRT